MRPTRLIATVLPQGKATCSHGAPWWRDDCPECNGEPYPETTWGSGGAWEQYWGPPHQSLRELMVDALRRLS